MFVPSKNFSLAGGVFLNFFVVPFLTLKQAHCVDQLCIKPGVKKMFGTTGYFRLRGSVRVLDPDAA